MSTVGVTVESVVSSGTNLDLNDLYPVDLSSGVCSQESGPSLSDRYPGPAAVRRPKMGMTLKAERHGYLQVFDANRDLVPLYNSSTSYWPPSHKQDAAGAGEKKTFNKSSFYTDFLIQRVVEQRSEKIQIVETFGEDFFYAFGERPVVLAVSGTLFNSLDFSWRTRFWENYERYLRGTRLVEMGGVAYLGWDDQLAEGYIIGASASEDANTEGLVNLSFSFLVTDRIAVSNGMLKSLQDIMDGKASITSFLELELNNGLEIFTGSSLTITSKGMRNRQRLAHFGILGTMIARGSFDTLAELIVDPESTLTAMGQQWLGALGDAGADLVYETMGDWLNLGPKDKEGCTPYSLSGKTLAKEWWIDTVGWLWRAARAMEQAGVNVHPWVYDALVTPDTFITIFVPRAMNATGSGKESMMILGAIGLGAGLTGGIISMATGVSTSNIAVIGSVIS